MRVRLSIGYNNENPLTFISIHKSNQISACLLPFPKPMKFLQIILICLRVTILMSFHQVDVLLCKYNTCKYYYSVYNELFFFHFFFQASQRRVPAKNNPWATVV